MMRLLIASLLFATPVIALTTKLIVFIAEGGTTFHVGTTAENVVFVAPDDAPDDLYILTPDCVATNVTHGTGSWGHEAVGWQIAFDGVALFWFPGQMPPLDAPDCLMLR